MKKATQVSAAKRLSISSFIVAAVFFFNPSLNIIDVLPDFFGCLFLLKGLDKLSDLCPALADARDNVSRLRWFMLLKLFSILLIPLEMTDDALVLVLTFAFAVIEAIYIFPALGQIFSGIEYLTTRFGGRAAYKGYKNVTTVTYLFFIVRPVLGLIPELFSLSDYDYSGYVTAGVQIDITRYKPGFIAFGIFVTVAVGVIWLAYVIPYIRRISRETEVLERIIAEYDDKIGSNTGLLFSRRMHSSLFIMGIAGIFLLKVWFDGMNVIPSFVYGLFALAAIFSLGESAGSKKPMLTMAGIFTGLSVISFAVSSVFSYRHSYIRDVFYDIEAYTFYNVTRVTTILEYAALIGLYLLIWRALSAVVAHEYRIDGIRDSRLVMIYSEQQRELEKRFAVSGVLFLLSAVASCVYSAFRAEITEALTEAWLIPLLLTLVWFFHQKDTYDTLDEQLARRYR